MISEYIYEIYGVLIFVSDSLTVQEHRMETILFGSHPKVDSNTSGVRNTSSAVENLSQTIFDNASMVISNASQAR